MCQLFIYFGLRFVILTHSVVEKGRKTKLKTTPWNVCVFALEWLIWKAYFILFQDLQICRCFLCVLNSIKKNLCIEKEQIRTQRNLIGTYRLVELSTESIEISVIHSKKIIVYCASCSKWAWVDMLFESWI